MEGKKLVTFYFDGLQIALADENYVWIVGNYGYRYEGGKPCLIKMKRELFIESLNDWINQRAEYNKRNAQGAGVTEIEEYKDLPTMTIGKHFWEDLDVDVETTFDFDVNVIETTLYYNQMEHG